MTHEHNPIFRHHALKSWARYSRTLWARYFIDDVSALSQSQAFEETPLPKLLKFTVATLSVSTLAFIGWSAITPIKELARTEGQVVPTGYSRLVQHLEGGLVREILVHEGDFVQKDQVLVRLDGAGTEEDWREQEARVLGLSLQRERLSALLEDRAADFSKFASQPEQAKEQQKMFDTALEARRRERAVLEEQIEQKRTAITRIEQSLATAQSNLTLSGESQAIYAKLTKDGLAARTTYIKKQEEYNSRKGDVSSLSRQKEEAAKELTEYKERLDALAAQQRDSAYNELHRVESDLAQSNEMLKKRQDRVARLEVRSPVMGYVKGLKLNTIGAVIPAGQTLMEVVPVEEQLVVELKIMPQQIGRIETGQTVQVKVDSYDYVRFGTIEGHLESISATTFTDEARREDYYKGRVRLIKNYAGGQPGMHPVIPGMTVDADIVTGEKSVLAYLLKPIRSAMYNSLTEQ